MDFLHIVDFYEPVTEIAMSLRVSSRLMILLVFKRKTTNKSEPRRGRFLMSEVPLYTSGRF